MMDFSEINDSPRYSRSRSNSSQSHRSHLSARSDTTWRYSVFGPERLGKGAMLFTGPDGIRDHYVMVEPEHRFVGEGTMSPEGTSEVDYLWRAPRTTPHPRPKSQCVGEIGWGIPGYMDWEAPSSGAQIRLGPFRQEVEDRHTHLYQSPWYPAPSYSGRYSDTRRPQTSPAATMYTNQPQANTVDRPGSRASSGRQSVASSSSHYSRYSTQYEF